MKTKKENRNKNRIIDIVFRITLGCLFMLFLLISMFYSIKNRDSGRDHSLGDLVSMLCQVVISIACCIVSLLGIAISLQKEDIYGLSRRHFDNLRVGIRFSVLRIVIVTLLLSAVCLISYSMNLYWTCIYGLSILMAFCMIACYTELPLMCLREKSILAITKKRLAVEMDKADDLSLDLKTVIKNQITEDYNLKTIYSKFKSKKDEEFNKKLLIKLLEIQCDYAFELSKLDETVQGKKAERLVDNIKDILRFKDEFDALSITKNELINYRHLITRVLFRTADIQSTERKTMYLVFDSLPFRIQNEKQREFVLLISIDMISASLTNSDLRFAKELKRVCSTWRYSLDKGDTLTIAFAITSIHLQYLYVSASNVTTDYKDKIAEFLDDRSVIDYHKTMSWRALYSRFLRHFSLNAQDFFYFYHFNKNNWDMRVYDSQAHIVIMDESRAIMWFLANLFSSYVVFDYDYNDLLSQNGANRVMIQQVGDRIINDIATKERMLEFVAFYKKDSSFTFFEIDEERNHRFEEFISRLHVEDLNKRINETGKVDYPELADRYQRSINSTIQNEWGHSSSVDLQNVAPKYLRMVIEVKSVADNYSEVLEEYLAMNIFYEIEESIEIKTVTRSKSSCLLDFMRVQKDIHVAESIVYDIEGILVEHDAVDKVRITSFDSSIWSGYYLMGNKALSFGCAVKIRIDKLSKQEVSEKAEEYKAQDGRYIFEGAFLSREEIENYIEKQFASLVMEFKYKVNSEGVLVYKIDYLESEELGETEEPTDESVLDEAREQSEEKDLPAEIHELDNGETPHNTKIANAYKKKRMRKFKKK